ncbi:acyl-CoA dehydrogenase family protein [Amycolatopsis vastitatis]|uniref:Desulfurization protein n=1 Tax=Amycolatopsis vastitatis TaxID=1905142 RepID=A0A229T0Z4_9PSEU|nr:acyl-CoA dehydrogenase family protein [Amycolatopsis vastitatis]OXM64723.1 desulfurization protein [Amycolatopsis vastitatis]
MKITTWEQEDLVKGRAEVLARVRALRTEMSDNGVRIDADGTDVAENMRLLGEAGVNRLSVPAEYGGLWSGDMWSGWRDTTEVLVEISAADGSTGMCWTNNGLHPRRLFAADLPRETKEQLADELINDGRRLVSSNSEAGAKGPVTGRRVPGGVVVSGTKTFNTNSGGGGRDLLIVGFALPGPDEDLKTAMRHEALVRLDAPGVRQAHDWDNMGQRGTHSQTITYDEVFVPDGWHFPATLTDPNAFGAGMLFHAALMQGIGEGAFEAAIGYLRSLNRGSMPRFPTALEDPLMHRQLGEMSSELAAARAYLLSVAGWLEEPGADPQTITIHGFRSKVASNRVSLDVTGRIHDLTGARSTANRYRFDRFWRNARTFATHDSIDAKNALIGAYELSGELPNVLDYFRI